MVSRESRYFFSFITVPEFIVVDIDIAILSFVENKTNEKFNLKTNNPIFLAHDF